MSLKKCFNKYQWYILLVFLLFTVIIFLSNFVSAVTTYKVSAMSFNITNTEYPIGTNGLGNPAAYRSQEFTALETITTDKVCLKVGSQVTALSTQMYNISIQTDSSDHPSGTLVAALSKKTVPGNTFVINKCNNITFNASFTITNGQKYHIVSEWFPAAVGNNKYYQAALNDGNVYSGGKANYRNSIASAWTFHATEDLGFMVYKITSSGDTSPPTITNARCTSCNAGNLTSDSTPTINVTLSKSGTSCISNLSSGNFSNCIRKGGKCSIGSVTTSNVCTLPSNQSLSRPYVFKSLYLWANATTGGYQHSVYNLSVNIMLNNTKPSVPVIVSPINGQAYQTVAIRYYSTDYNGNSITYKVYINNTLNRSTTTNITVWNSSNGYYALKVSAYDGTNYSANSSAVSFYKDNKKPRFANQAANLTSVFNGATVQFNITVFDLTASKYRFLWNVTGSYKNDSLNSLTSGQTVSTLKRINSTILRKTVCWKYWANDSAKNVNISQASCFYANPCLYSGSGRYNVLCSDNCNLGTIDVKSNTVNISGDGVYKANLINYKNITIKSPNGCKAWIKY